MDISGLWWMTEGELCCMVGEARFADEDLEGLLVGKLGLVIFCWFTNAVEL